MGILMSEIDLVKSEVSVFEKETGTREMHAIVESSSDDTLEAWHSILEELNKIEKTNHFTLTNRLFTRVFLQDATVQASLIHQDSPQLLSSGTAFIGQAPLSGSTLAVWIYWVDGNQPVISNDHCNSYQSNGLTHLWTGGITGFDSQEVFGQTKEIFEKYNDTLSAQGANMKDHAIRTWLFSKDVDHEYADLVEARNQFFDKHGLTSDTHYISSTGIQGSHADSSQKVCMDTYSILGIDQEQIQFLKAATHLCPTHDYGVAFERATAVTYGDRKHVYISGTASIDTQGDVLHIGNVKAQTERTLENIEVLLDEADCKLDDLAMAIVYLRNTDEFETVFQVVEKRLANVPKIYVHGPVCRPTWLVEIEGIAIKEVTSKFKNY